VEVEVSVDDDQVIDVLLIEDDQETLEMYKMKLEKDGYRVHLALDGEEGIRRATELTPDIIYLTVKLLADEPHAHGALARVT